MVALHKPVAQKESSKVIDPCPHRCLDCDLYRGRAAAGKVTLFTVSQYANHLLRRERAGDPGCLGLWFTAHMVQKAGQQPAQYSMAPSLVTALTLRIDNSDPEWYMPDWVSYLVEKTGAKVIDLARSEREARREKHTFSLRGTNVFDMMPKQADHVSRFALDSDDDLVFWPSEQTLAQESAEMGLRPTYLGDAERPAGQFFSDTSIILDTRLEMRRTYVYRRRLTQVNGKWTHFHPTDSLVNVHYPTRLPENQHYIPVETYLPDYVQRRREIGAPMYPQDQQTQGWATTFGPRYVRRRTTVIDLDGNKMQSSVDVIDKVVEALESTIQMDYPARDNWQVRTTQPLVRVNGFEADPTLELG